MKQSHRQAIQCLIIGADPAGYTAAIYASADVWRPWMQNVS
jgi:thioredoxin reductase